MKCTAPLASSSSSLLLSSLEWSDTKVYTPEMHLWNSVGPHARAVALVKNVALNVSHVPYSLDSG